MPAEMTGADSGSGRGGRGLPRPAPRRADVTATPYADAPPAMQRAVRLLHLLVMLDPELADEVIDIDEADVIDFYGVQR